MATEMCVTHTALAAGQRLAGPAIVPQEDCTTCLPAGFVCAVDRYGNLVIEPQAQADLH